MYVYIYLHIHTYIHICIEPRNDFAASLSSSFLCVHGVFVHRVFCARVYTYDRAEK